MTRKSKLIILAVLSLFYWGSRAVYIDSDIPKWKIFYFSQIDELSYTIGAYNIASPPDSAYAAIVQKDFIPITLFQDVVTAGSLSVFGNNYLGLRFPSMLMGYCILIILFLLFEKRFGIQSALIASGILLLDVGFLLSNRIAEPTIFRLFATLSVIFFLSKMIEGRAKSWQFFAAGLLSSFAFLFFYPTNFFIVPATFISLAVLLIFAKKDAAYGFKPWGYYFLSSFLCLGFFLLVTHRIMGDLGRFSEILNFSDRVATSDNRGLISTLRGFASNIKQISSASFFFFNPYFFVLGIISLGFFLISVLKKFVQTRVFSLDHIMWIFLAMFLCQTIFVNDYPRKKMLILFPFVVYALIYVLDYIREKYSRIGFAKFAFTLTVPIMIVTAFLQFKYVYKQPSFEYKKAMISLRKYNGKILAGNLSYSFRLYNNYIPLLDHYTYYRDHNKYQQVLRQLSRDKNFAGSIYYAEEKYVKELQELNLCPVDTILSYKSSNELKITMNIPCSKLK